MYKNFKQIRILFLEDNLTFATHTIKLLELYVKEVIHCISIRSALQLFEEEDIDIIISDLKVEDGIALSFIKQVRVKNTNIPIVILSAHKDEKFLLEAIPLGLTTYAIKPINLEEFKSILQKCMAQLRKLNSNITHLKNNIYYDTKKKIILKDNKSIDLRQREVLFIELFLNNKDGIVTKDLISENIWEDKVMSEAALKNFLLRIRKKVGIGIFKNIKGLGYKL